MAGEIGHEGENPLPDSFGSRPWLFQMHGSTKQTCTFFDPMNNSLEERILPEFLRGKACLGCYEEWVLLADELTRECFFLSIISFSKIYLPPFPECPDIFQTIVSISSPLDTSNCIVILVCFSKTFLLVCSPSRKRWKKVPLKYFNKNIGSLGGPSVIYNEQLFVMDTMGVTLVIDVAPLIKGCVKMSIIDHLWPCPVSPSLYTYLVKCAGDLFSVLVHSYGSGKMITHVEVRRLELSGNEMHWRRVQDIGDHTFFLAGRCGRSLPANKAWGLQRNCIYVPVDYSDGARFYKFCLDDGLLTFTFLLETNGELNRLQWALPTKMMQTVEEDIFNSCHVTRSNATDSTVTGKEDEFQMVNISRRWDELPIELVELFFPRLSLVDCLRLPSVCKGWFKAASSFVQKGKVWPWLMHLPNLKYQSCKFFDPLCCKEYTLKINADVVGRDHLALRFSKNGWVVVTEGNKRVFILNPFTAQVINLPPLLRDYIFDGISFISEPTSPDFVVYGFFFQICGEFVKISSWRPGEEEWTVLEFRPSVPFFPSSNNPVLCRGEFFCLGRKGELGVFNPELETWMVLCKPEPVHTTEPEYGIEYCHLLEFNGDLISVFRTDDTKKLICVFKLDQLEMKWEKLENLGDVMFFVDYRNSIAIPSPEKKYANRIYVPRFEGSMDSKKGVFYSMEDNRYHPSLHTVEEPLTCVWIEPKLASS
ncbi:F-box protein family-like [Rhynchospora pubera]|uniref:F-box protein family-like n=1 Tax=Rhynchospora pubera TaxID=906938 RepID=A0AAV8CJL1_9POAL|nr:F-box protein family-like [Rhynchospora pubera]KAJ4792568.1 F-box protein family-like [Rhynchospora pubera]